MSRVLVVLAEGFEEIEAITAIDVLRRANVEVITMGVGSKTIIGSHDIKICTDLDSSEKISLDDLDGVVIPGGLPGATNLADSSKVLSIIKKMGKSDKLVAAICAAPGVVLGKTSLLNGKNFTCYPGFEDQVKNGNFSTNGVVIDGNIITSRGPGTAMKFSLALVKYLTTNEMADKLSKGMLVP